jgi:hypothetical protein
MRVLKYLKFFEEVELNLGELDKQRIGGKRGNFLIKKLKEPKVVLDIKEMSNLEETSQYKPTIVEDEIEEFFGVVENTQDPCGIDQILIENNVISIHTEDLGKDNVNYNPGF